MTSKREAQLHEAHHLPLTLCIRHDQHALVVGAGEVGLRKIANLLAFGVAVVCVEPQFIAQDEVISRIVEVKPFTSRSLADKDLYARAQERLTVRVKPFEPADITESTVLVFACTSSQSCNAAVYQACREKGVLFNSAMKLPNMNEFYLPATLMRGDFSVSIATAGKSPSLARKERLALEDRYSDAFGDYLDLLGEVRDLVLSQIDGDAVIHRAYLRALHKLPLLAACEAGEALDAHAVFADLCERMRGERP